MQEAGEVSNNNKELLTNETELEETRIIEGFNDPATKAQNQRTPETREMEVAREQALEAKYKTETGKDVEVVALEGENVHVDGIVKNSDDLKFGYSESDVIRVMHLMTHQKIIAEDVWGAVPMTPSTIDQLITHLKNHPEYDPDLLYVAQRWKEGNFSAIDHEHNYLHTRLKATKGAATGIATSEQEKEFVLKYFDPSVAREIGFQ
ncbi:DUF6241 domain-containing protein [Domibacillus aminovorans]|uniref:Uncharacterized protein n=1 Tax=Domibacillus aminovorans TaxID=29332 RepID=A0A177LBA4_9BACI|nr:DUF6241 domain-containing protein [Domibacillus aminovorans]OAH63060.1 hypothetical protein AWH49_06860 [Domibacillus aminovorans]